MGSVNKVILLGRLGRDIELRYTPGGEAVGNCTMATSETWKDKNSGERKEKTEWHRLVIWGRRAEGLQEYLRKGTQVYVEGRLQTRQWDDKDGNKRSTTEIRVDNLEFVGGRGGAEDGSRENFPGQKPNEELNAASSPAPELSDEDIPF